MEAREALHRLLAGTGIRIVHDDGDTIALRAPMPMTASLAAIPLTAADVHLSAVPAPLSSWAGSLAGATLTVATAVVVPPLPSSMV